MRQKIIDGPYAARFRFSIPGAAGYHGGWMPIHLMEFLEPVFELG
ncbi:hypothetical protein [Actinophytocola sp.]